MRLEDCKGQKSTAEISLSFLDAGPSFEEGTFGEELILEAEDDSGKRQLRLFLPDEPKEPEPQG